MNREMKHCVSCGTPSRILTGHVHISEQNILIAAWCCSASSTLCNNPNPFCSYVPNKVCPPEATMHNGCHGLLKDVRAHWRSLGVGEIKE